MKKVRVEGPSPLVMWNEAGPRPSVVLRTVRSEHFVREPGYHLIKDKKGVVVLCVEVLPAGDSCVSLANASREHPLAMVLARGDRTRVCGAIMENDHLEHYEEGTFERYLGRLLRSLRTKVSVQSLEHIIP